eukprot:TRINITY_DN16286_c0_g1_i1.p1 TRINITY_DN16286_c0_g1~~TRINITY_DN16286_c0_g1_i1.p1  ORF type:complete len:142 (-),score=9.81 TRINITY_DN16286_c0_g1_i1:19-444(-)
MTLIGASCFPSDNRALFLSCSSSYLHRRLSLPRKFQGVSQTNVGLEIGKYSFNSSGKPGIFMKRSNYACATPEQKHSSLKDEDEDPTTNFRKADWISTLHQVQAATRIFLVALFWIFLFFGASAWDGVKNKRRNRRGSKRK